MSGNHISYLCCSHIVFPEQCVNWGGEARRERLDYVVRLTRMAAGYGKTILWTELGDEWAKLAADEAFINAISEFKDHFVPGWKATISEGAHCAQGALLGLWLSGAVSNWGVHGDLWYWAFSGFCGHTRPELAVTPGTLYGLIWTIGMSAGATVYNIENPWNTWDPPGTLTGRMKDVVLPLVRAMSSRRLIPDRHEMLEEAHIACRPGKADPTPLFENTYTIRNHYQFIPATGRYHWIPTLPGKVPQETLDAFDDVLGPEALEDPESIRSLFNKQYPAQASCSAWAVRTGDLMFAMQNHENAAEEQEFTFELAHPFVSLRGTIDNHAYVIARQDGPRLFLSAPSPNPPIFLSCSLRSFAVNSSPPSRSLRLGAKLLLQIHDLPKLALLHTLPAGKGES